MVLTANLEFRIRVCILSMRENVSSGRLESQTRGQDVIYIEQKANDGGLL